MTLFVLCDNDTFRAAFFPSIWVLGTPYTLQNKGKRKMTNRPRSTPPPPLQNTIAANIFGGPKSFPIARNHPKPSQEFSWTSWAFLHQLKVFVRFHTKCSPEVWTWDTNSWEYFYWPHVYRPKNILENHLSSRKALHCRSTARQELFNPVVGLP